MINLKDYIYISKNTKRYRLSCDSCRADRGYGMKSRSAMLCKKCTHLGKCYFDHSGVEFRSKMSNSKKNQIPHNKGISKYTKEQKTLRCNMSSAIRLRLSKRGFSKKGESYLLLLGYTIEDLKLHLESKFHSNPRNGTTMTWDNWGTWNKNDDTWHIDHIIPDSHFSYSSMHDQQFKNCWSLSNLQPMWAKDNLSKGSKLV